MVTDVSIILTHVILFDIILLLHSLFYSISVMDSFTNMSSHDRTDRVIPI